ncbi:MAG: DUF3368 domain-containing protein [Luteitalea sp.]|nr:DUF3368 domain-containing protein [Luteitalea sp.]
MNAVSNSSPLIALAAIERLVLLPLLFDSVIIPPAVAFETRRTIPARPAWLYVRSLQNQLPAAVLRPTLGDGEREAIALALEASADRVVLDDLPARRVAQELGLNVIGTLGLLLAAKRAGLVDAIRPELDNLVRTGFFLGQQLYEEVLRAAGEFASLAD